MNRFQGDVAALNSLLACAGSGFGQISLPRIGQEVVVQFLDGNPDRPLVVGSVYNESHHRPGRCPRTKPRAAC